MKNFSEGFYVVKGLNHKIDFKMLDKNGRNQTQIRDMARFLKFLYASAIFFFKLLLVVNAKTTPIVYVYPPVLKTTNHMCRWCPTNPKQ